MKFLSTIKSLIVKVGTDRVQFKDGVYETSNKKLIEGIKKTLSFQDGVITEYAEPEAEKTAGTDTVVDATGDVDA